MAKYIMMVDTSDDCLKHYGVLGMKWHHHKAINAYNKARKYKLKALKAEQKGKQEKVNKYVDKHYTESDKYKARLQKNSDNANNEIQKIINKGSKEIEKLEGRHGYENTYDKIEKRINKDSKKIEKWEGLRDKYADSTTLQYDAELYRGIANAAQKTAMGFGLAKVAESPVFIATIPGKHQREVANERKSYLEEKRKKRYVK